MGNFTLNREEKKIVKKKREPEFGYTMGGKTQKVNTVKTFAMEQTPFVYEWKRKGAVCGVKRVSEGLWRMKHEIGKGGKNGGGRTPSWKCGPVASPDSQIKGYYKRTKRRSSKGGGLVAPSHLQQGNPKGGMSGLGGNQVAAHKKVVSVDAPIGPSRKTHTKKKKTLGLQGQIKGGWGKKRRLGEEKNNKRDTTIK